MPGEQVVQGRELNFQAKVEELLKGGNLPEPEDVHEERIININVAGNHHSGCYHSHNWHQ